MTTNFALSLSAVGKRAFTPSSLLIPECYLEFFNMRKRQFGSINAYFLYLLVSYVQKLPAFGITPDKTTRKWKKKYQKSGLNLKKRSFVVDPLAWEAYREVSFRFGLSICHLFVIAMELDMHAWQDLGCPTEKPVLVEIGSNGEPVRIESRNSYPLLDSDAPEKLHNFTKVSFLGHKLEFGPEVLTRSGSFSD